jgi:hypothetical protein
MTMFGGRGTRWCRHSLCAWLVVAVVGLAPPSARAEEGGTGHYMPGATASFIDAFPFGDKPAAAYVNIFTYYDGRAGKDRQILIAGRAAGNLKVQVEADSSAFAYQTPWTLLGGHYGFSVAIPYQWLYVKASVSATIAGRTISVRKTDSMNGIGDMSFLPFMLGWQRGDLKYAVTFGIYAPTGSYKKGRLVNTSLNYWTFEPQASFSYLSTKNGIELTGFAGFDCDTKNSKTDYQTGSVLHLDATLAQHFPIFGGFGSVGTNAFYYEQITADSGSGATLGTFRGEDIGIGPETSYATKVHGFDVVAEAKWLSELDVQHRLKGDIVWV